MSKARLFLCLTAGLLGCVAVAGPGTTALPFLRVGQGARATALGDAYVALADDATAVYWNPAGLGVLTDYRMALSHHQWFAGIKDELLHVALPVGAGSLGCGLAFSNEPGIETWDGLNQPGDTFSVWGGSLALGYGLTLDQGYSLGFTGRGFAQNLRTDRLLGGALDAGFLAQPLPELGLGFAARNLGVGYSSGTVSLPAELCIGASGRLPLSAESPSAPLLVGTASVSRLLSGPLHFGAGVEFLPLRELAVRVGYRSGQADLSEFGFLAGLTAGLGVSLGSFAIDYSLAPYGELGIVHRFGLSARAERRGSGSLELSIVDASTLEPIWAYVSLSGPANLTRETPRTGRLTLRRLPAGTLTIHASRTGYVPRADTMLILGDREQTAVIALKPIEHGGLSGTILDAGTRRPIPGLITYRGEVYGVIEADPVLGSFAVTGIPSGTYSVTAAGPTQEYLPQTCSLVVEYGRITDRTFRLVRSRQILVLEGINFETGKADILPKFEDLLDRAGELLLVNPTVTVEIVGHTDPREISTTKFPSNWELSRARAAAVRDYLTTRFDIAPNRLSANGYADTQPIAANDTETGMAKNRRVEFRITGEQ